MRGGGTIRCDAAQPLGDDNVGQLCMKAVTLTVASLLLTCSKANILIKFNKAPARSRRHMQTRCQICSRTRMIIQVKHSWNRHQAHYQLRWAFRSRSAEGQPSACGGVSVPFTHHINYL